MLVKAAEEGAILLKNDSDVLPFVKGDKISIFGRIQTTYYKGGTGSGGSVASDEAVSIRDALISDPTVSVNENLCKIYDEWISDHPYEHGPEWPGEPFFQEEMPLSDSIAEDASKISDKALIVIGRTSGEERDNKIEEGSFLLTENEKRMMNLVCKHFDKVAVVLNISNLIDMSFIDEYKPDSVLILWQGGPAGGIAAGNILVGYVSPSGKLPDTIAKQITDYPSTENFGFEEKVFYKEDIYVGYRYFETFNKDAVRFPFGFGLSYTDFHAEFSATKDDVSIFVTAFVTNTGKFPGKEVIEIYYESPCGLLGTPSRQLANYKKTKELLPGETENFTIGFSIKDMASYDDSGLIEHPSSYILQAGDYKIYAGTDVRSAQCVYTWHNEEELVVKTCSESATPFESFMRLHATENISGTRETTDEAVPTRLYNTNELARESRPEAVAFKGNLGIKLKDVYEGRNSIHEFISQIPPKVLSYLVCGEGMDSPKTTPGTGGAIGGLTDELLDFGLPVVCVTDGPSGLRFNDGTKATQVPIATLLASTWNDELVENIYKIIAKEMNDAHVDGLLGPAMNIHRNPLCGRNFEYFSEDPLLTGKIASAITRGIADTGCFSVIKHFCANNQETERYQAMSILSERALREIYIRGFKTVCENGKNISIMTSYNPVNGYWTASNYDILKKIVRDEWKFDGMIMTDWWASMNSVPNGQNDGNDLASMIRATNDIYMVVPDTKEKEHNILQAIDADYISLGELQESAGRILKFILQTPTFKRFYDSGCVRPVHPGTDDTNMKIVSSFENIDDSSVLPVTFHSEAGSLLVIDVAVHDQPLAQFNIIFRANGRRVVNIAVKGSNGESTIVKRAIKMPQGSYSLTCDYSGPIEIRKLEIKE